MVKKAFCINNIIIKNPIIQCSDYCLDIGEIYTIHSIAHNFVIVYKDNIKIGVYPILNFKLIEDFRQEKISKLINE